MTPFPVRPEEIRLYFRLLETDDEAFAYSTAARPPAGRWTISGLDLPAETLHRVYAGNAARLLPRLAAGTGEHLQTAGVESAQPRPENS